MEKTNNDEPMKDENPIKKDGDEDSIGIGLDDQDVPEPNDDLEDEPDKDEWEESVLSSEDGAGFDNALGGNYAAPVSARPANMMDNAI